MPQIYEYLINIFFSSPFEKGIFKKLPNAPRHSEDFIFSVFNYQHKKVKEIIRYLKNHNDFLLKKEISIHMSEHVIDYLSDQQSMLYFMNPIVIPVPISNKRLRERGFNQTHLLAKYFAKNIDGIYKKNILYKHRQTRKQALIKNRNERFQNIKNAFTIKTKQSERLKNKDIIIIDDLSTTGATLLEIKKLLKKSGARNVIAVTIAH